MLFSNPLYWLAAGSLLALIDAWVDPVAYDEMRYLVGHAFDVYGGVDCDYPEGTVKLMTWIEGAKGYLALDGQRKWIIMAFRGSWDAEDWATDEDQTLVPYTALHSEGCVDCLVHEGVQLAWANNTDSVIAAIHSAKDAYPDYQIVITGHSLGGAYTAMCGTSIAREFGIGSVKVISFAAYRIGNYNFARYQEAAYPGETLRRVTSMDDNVPQVMTRIQGFYHGGTEYWITSEPSPPPQNITHCCGSEDPNCNAGHYTNATTQYGMNAAHLLYFIPITTQNCTADPAKVPVGYVPPACGEDCVAPVYN